MFANNTLAGAKSNINVKRLEGYKVNSILRITQILKIFNSPIANAGNARPWFKKKYLFPVSQWRQVPIGTRKSQPT